MGILGGAPVWEIHTIGGYVLVSSTRDNKPETLGVGSHRALARHIAKKRAPDLRWTDLAKADHVDYAHYASLLPAYEALTDRVRQAEER